VILFYNIFKAVYQAGIGIAANWNPKAQKWIDGRKNWQQQLKQNWLVKPEEFVVWMHCASLGEFEQGRPIIEKIKTQNPNSKFLITFFSPSGFEIRKDYEEADYVMYLPFDSATNAKSFIDLVKPDLVIFVKYEFWHYYLSELKQRQIVTILVSGIFRFSQPFFQWWGGFHRNMLQKFSHLFVQDETSKQLLTKIGLQTNVTVAGDTRFDSVLKIVQEWKPVDFIDAFCLNHSILVAGSTWPADETILAEYINDDVNMKRIIIAPHEIKEETILHVKKLFPHSICYSDLLKGMQLQESTNCLIIDNIGYLSRIYKYANITYVGGGFTKSGIHNILEAAVFGKAVITGPSIEKFREAVELKKLGGLFIIERQKPLIELITEIDGVEAGRIAAIYVLQNSGTTDIIVEWIQENRLFTKE
jgi:3-deoxy-D-manno-octulosonic-acid transferase